MIYALGHILIISPPYLMTMPIVNKKERHDIYIGTGSEWANPFKKLRTPKAANAKYQAWLDGDDPSLPEKLAWITSNINILKGKVLGCDCIGPECHGHILLNWMEYRDLVNFSWDPLELKSGGTTRMLIQLRDLVHNCRLCSLGKQMCEEHNDKFNPHVFSNMTESKWFVVGQNPGYNECIEGEPFVDDAGKFFDKCINKNGLTRSDFYISNAIKCHMVSNEKPTKEHADACELFLRLEIRILKPKLIITLGSTAFDIFCPDKQMSDHLGTIIKSEKFDVKIYPIYHPSTRDMMVEARANRFVNDIDNLCQLIKTIGAKTK